MTQAHPDSNERPYLKRLAARRISEAFRAYADAIERHFDAGMKFPEAHRKAYQAHIAKAPPVVCEAFDCAARMAPAPSGRRQQQPKKPTP
jgi:hypothetical protein